MALYSNLDQEQREILIKDCETLLETEAKDNAVLYQRMTIVLFVLKDISMDVIVTSWGVSKRTVYRWSYTVIYDKHHWQALKIKKFPGRPRKLNKIQMNYIKKKY